MPSEQKAKGTTGYPSAPHSLSLQCPFQAEFLSKMSTKSVYSVKSIYWKVHFLRLVFCVNHIYSVLVKVNFRWCLTPLTKQLVLDGYRRLGFGRGRNQLQLYLNHLLDQWLVSLVRTLTELYRRRFLKPLTELLMKFFR